MITGTLAELVVAQAAFLLVHLCLPREPVRSLLVVRLGEPAFRGVFSVLALLGLIWTCVSYAHAPTVWLWYPAAWQWFVPLLVMPVALAFLVGGVSTPNPAALGPQPDLSDGEIARGILRITRNPVMWAIALWGGAHAVPNGEAASLFLFGGMTILAIVGLPSIEAKAAHRHGVAWSLFAQATSNVPFLAIMRGQQSFATAVREFGLNRLAITAVLYGALLHMHGWLFGVTALPPV